MLNRDALNLYAKVEDLLGVKEAAPALYAHYFLFLNGITFDSILDVGCGSGDFLLQINRAFEPKRVLGIDLSSMMVEQSRAQGIPAQCVDLCDLEGSFDVVSAVFDMLNYLDDEALKRLLGCLQERVNSGGYLLCDINTLYGFEEVAVGSFSVDDEDRFLAIESDFERPVYSSEFILFEKNADQSYQKSKGVIKQYYHTVEKIKEALGDMDLVLVEDISLYVDEVDKSFLVFQKRV